MKTIGLCLAALIAACEPGAGAPGVDAGRGSADAGTGEQDAAPTPTQTDDIAGTWDFGAGDEAACTAVIGAGTFEITCPGRGLPWTIAPGCDQTRADVRLFGALAGDLTASVDTIDEYQGESCAMNGYGTGVPVVTPGVATLWAQRTAERASGGFWSAVDGDWTFELRTAADPGARLECLVSLDAGAFTIACPDGTPWEPLPGCSESAFVELGGTIDASHLEGVLSPVLRRSGPACEAAGLGLEEWGPELPLTATRQ